MLRILLAIAAVAAVVALAFGLYRHLTAEPDDDRGPPIIYERTDRPARA